MNNGGPYASQPPVVAEGEWSTDVAEKPLDQVSAVELVEPNVSWWYVVEHCREPREPRKASTISTGL